MQIFRPLSAWWTEGRLTIQCLLEGTQTEIHVHVCPFVKIPNLQLYAKTDASKGTMLLPLVRSQRTDYLQHIPEVKTLPLLDMNLINVILC